MEDPNQPQVEVPGAEAEAKAKETAEVATEAEKVAEVATKAATEAKAAAEAAAPERTYSQEEWSKRESEKDTEISTYRNVASQATMQSQIIQQQQAEFAAQAKDKSDVDQGLITETEVTQRQQGRQKTAQMQPGMEQMGRMAAARDFGERYGVNPYELLSDQAIQTPQQMDAKAKQLAQSKSDTASKAVSDKIEALEAKIKGMEEGDQQFDTGQHGSGVTNLEGLSPEEITAEAYSTREVSRRQKARKK